MQAAARVHSGITYGGKTIMKKIHFRRVIVAFLALSMLALCFVSCDSGKGDDTTADVSKVTIEIYDENNEIFMRGKDFEIADGETVRSAVEKLVAAREGTVVFDTTGMFNSFKNSDGAEVKAHTKMNDDGVTATAYYLEWSYNGTAMSMKAPADTVLKNGDTVKISVKVDANVTPTAD